jgi:hypothetical protein
MATNKKPSNQLRCGNIKATIWQNSGEKGPFFSTTFSRPFKDQSGAWRNGTSFGLNDLEALSPWRVKPRSGSQLMPSNPEGMIGKPPAFRGLPATGPSL